MVHRTYSYLGEYIKTPYSIRFAWRPLSMLTLIHFFTFLIHRPLSFAASCVSWCYCCFVCYGFTYELYSGGGPPTTYIYCMTYYWVIAAPYVRSVVVSLHTVTRLMTIQATQWTMSSLYFLKLVMSYGQWDTNRSSTLVHVWHMDRGHSCFYLTVIWDVCHFYMAADVCLLIWDVPGRIRSYLNLKLPSLFAASLFWTFHIKSHNKSFIITISHTYLFIWKYWTLIWRRTLLNILILCHLSRKPLNPAPCTTKKTSIAD